MEEGKGKQEGEGKRKEGKKWRERGEEGRKGH